jgi:putative phosphoesterase
LIAHLGDVQTLSVLEELSEIAPVLAVQGNNDQELRSLLPEVVRMDVGRFSVVMVHGHGGYSARTVAKQFIGKTDLVLYGHSHIPKIERIEATTLFNPGSATDRRWHEHFGIGVVTFTDNRCAPELILFKDARELDNVKP